MLEIRNLSKAFNKGTINEKKVFDNLSLTIEDGEFVSVIGGNGSGKTTLLNLVAGTIKPDAGEIFLHNVENIEDKLTIEDRYMISLYKRVDILENTRTIREYKLKYKKYILEKRVENKQKKLAIVVEDLENILNDSALSYDSSEKKQNKIDKLTKNKEKFDGSIELNKNIISNLDKMLEEESKKSDNEDKVIKKHKRLSSIINILRKVYKNYTVFDSNGNIELSRLKDYNRAKYIGRVFQDPLKGTAANMRIYENLALSSKRGVPKTLRWAFTKKALVSFQEKVKILEMGLENRMNTKIGFLSGGQRQALTLLMATLKKPDLLLLDEHTSALDPKIQHQVMQMTKKIVERDNLTTLMITHNMQDAIEYGNRLIMLIDGKIVLDVKGEEKQKLTVESLVKRFGLM